jgi:glycosyltransferase involved in cell wall biosynthesis
MSNRDELGRVLYISHNGLTEPLGRRQALPYLTGLAALGWRITVVSFEKAATADTAAVSRVGELLLGSSVSWTPLRYHNHPPIVSTAYDIARGLWVARRLAPRHDLLHARSSVPALIANLSSRPVDKRWIFDLRGLLAEEYVDAGHWPPGGIRYRVAAAIESKLLRTAAGWVTLSKKVLDRPPFDTLSVRPHAVIPCSVDLGVFQPSADVRGAVRRELGWGDEPVLVYSGSLGSWYRLEEMLDLFRVAREGLPGLRFLILTPQLRIAQQGLQAHKVGDRVVARSASPDDIPRYLASCDAGICFIGRHRSKIASSPTKYGEYLASGLPVITNTWIGDASDLARERPWLLVDDFSPRAYRVATAALRALLADPANTRRAARDLATREFALSTAIGRYHSLYLKVLDR